MRKTMRAGGIVLVLILQSVVLAHAGHIYGTLVEGGTPVAGVGLEIACAGKTFPTMTQEDGSYKVFVNAKGRCTFTAHYKGQSPSIAIYSYDDPVGYNFELVSAGGVYKLEKQ